MSLELQIDTQVTIEGTARNAMAGAVVLTADRTPVYVDGVERWDGTIDGKPIRASGVLRRRAGDDVEEDGELAVGISGPHLVLEQPTWTVRVTPSPRRTTR